MEERIKQLEATVSDLIGIVEIFINHIGPDGEVYYFDYKDKETLRNLNMKLDDIKEKLNS